MLDNEAVEALRSERHRRHRRVLAYIQVLAVRKRKGRRAAQVIVPTAVRVEAGWDRTDPRAAFINLLGVRDAPLDGVSTDRAAAIAVEHRVSVADAHVGATVQLLPDESQPVTVIASDRGAIERVVGTRPVRVVQL